MHEDLETRLKFLTAFGIEQQTHSGKGLLDHLLGTCALLQSWGAPPTLCDAGLFHSVYGTEIYEATTIPASMRDRVREVIGDEAEHLAWLFGVMARLTLQQNLGRESDLFVVHHQTQSRIEINRQQFSDLVHMCVANDLEQLPRLPPAIVQVKLAMLLPFQGVLMEAAREALEQAVERMEKLGVNSSFL